MHHARRSGGLRKAAGVRLSGPSCVDVPDAEQGERAPHVGVEDVERPGDAVLAAGHQPVQVGPADQAGARAERRRRR